jgi:hypothetical protein
VAGQPVDGLTDRAHGLFGVHPRGDHVGGVGFCWQRGQPLQRRLASTGRSSMVAQQVDRHAEQPGQRARLQQAGAAPVAPGLQEHRGAELLGQPSIGGPPEAELVDGAGVALVQRTERRGVTRLRLRPQGLVGWLHHPFHVRGQQHLPAHASCHPSR